MSLPVLSLLDVFDIVAVSAVVYLFVLLIRGTRGLYMLTGLFICILVFALARLYQLQTLSWIFSLLLSNLFLVIVVIFQHDIRRFLTKVGRSTVLSPKPLQAMEFLEEIVKTSVSLANKKIGALIVIERGGHLRDHIEQGEILDARISKPLLTSIFLPVSPLHDGAVLIAGDRVVLASGLLPLSMSPDAARMWGTRHRAALGLVEETDAIVIVVSEEQGIVSLAVDGKLEENLDAIHLRERLMEILQPEHRLAGFTKLWQRLQPSAKEQEKHDDPA